MEEIDRELETDSRACVFRRVSVRRRGDALVGYPFGLCFGHVVVVTLTTRATLRIENGHHILVYLTSSTLFYVFFMTYMFEGVGAGSGCHDHDPSSCLVYAWIAKPRLRLETAIVIFTCTQSGRKEMLMFPSQDPPPNMVLFPFAGVGLSMRSATT